MAGAEVLYALAHPLSFVVLVAGFVLAVTVHGAVQARVADRFGQRSVRRQGRLTGDPRRHVDPIGAVAAALSGLGWTAPVALPDRRRRGPLLTVALSGAVANIVVGLALLVALRSAYGLLFVSSPALLLQRGVGLDVPLVATVLLLLGLSQLYVGVLSLVPLPPLDGGRLLFGLGPRSHGWQRAEHLLAEQNVGVAVVLVLLLIPLGSPLPLIPQLLDLVLLPPVQAVLHG